MYSQLILALTICFCFEALCIAQDGLAPNTLKLITWTGYDRNHQESLKTTNYFIDRKFVGRGLEGKNDLLKLMRSASANTDFVAVYRHWHEHYPNIDPGESARLIETNELLPRPPYFHDKQERDLIMEELEQNEIGHFTRALAGCKTTEEVHQARGTTPPPIYLIWWAKYNGIEQKKKDPNKAEFYFDGKYLGNGAFGAKAVATEFLELPPKSLVLLTCTVLDHDEQELDLSHDALSKLGSGIDSSIREFAEEQKIELNRAPLLERRKR